jgi:hypothetical protein
VAEDMADVFVIAVVASLDAGLIAATVFLLGRPRPATKLLAFLVGGMSLSIGFGLLIVLALHGSRIFRGPDQSVSAIIEVAAGTLLLAVAIAVGSGRAAHWHARRRRRTDASRTARPSLSERAVGHDSLWIAWAAGAAYSVPGAYYLAGLALLVKLNRPTTTDILAIVGFNLIMFAFVEIPLLGFLFAPERTRALASKFSAWMSRRRRPLIVVLAGGGGGYLLVSGLSTLP